ncbi:CotH kinase family protein [Dactylosporangium sp. NPDC005572]|uniref:CotH kinase family protein n=1 Tax=Dactylosporangium sp. NPDC005572 TaxID=3156889 RepID=UPI0033B0C2F3
MVRLRLYWRLLAACAAFVVVLATFATARIRPFVTSPGAAATDRVDVDVAGRGDLFDADRPHSLRLTFRDADYQRMLDAYFTEGAKEYLEADLVVDGVLVPSVGVRLKGNSTLGALSRNGETRGRFPGGGGGFGGGGFARTPLRAEEPETLPWLVSFDHFAAGRRFQGHEEIALRVGSGAVLNEAVSLELLRAAGEAAQRYTYASLKVNDRPAVARLVVEHPDKKFAERLGADGVLYKALSTSRFADQGGDPVDYADDFKQVTMKGSQDLQPVIDLIRWATTASDAAFDRELAGHVDVEAFARYAALQNLLLNFDDMAGPGHNYYLWYDLARRRFTVVAWDHNLTFSGNAGQGPYDAARIGGPRGGNALKERALASAVFRPVYERAYRDLYRTLFASGLALSTVDKVASAAGGAAGAEAARLRDLIARRTELLAANEVVRG